MRRFNTYALIAGLLLAFCSASTLAQSLDPARKTTSTASCQFDSKQPNVRLNGSVADQTGAAVLGATVTLKCGNFRQDTHSAGDGSYNITAPAGTYQLNVEAPGFESSTSSVTLAATGSNQHNITLAIGRVSSIVSVTEAGGYVAVASTSSTKSDTPLLETPQSVSVVTSDQMSARNVQTVNEAIQYTAGVSVNTYGSDSRYDYINIRGFNQSTYGLFRDNSRWQSGQVSGQIDPYLIQEVDVIKGPSSVLFGQNTPGGLINLVTKRPQPTTTNELIWSFGSHERRQLQGDFGGPLGSDKVRYRLTGLYRKSDTQVNYVPDNRWFVAPALTFAPTNNTTLTVLSDYQADDTGWGQFLPSQGTLTDNPNGKISTDFFTGEPGYDYFHRKQWSAGTLFEHRFTDSFIVRNTFRHSKINYHGRTAFGGGLQDDLRTLNRFGFGNSLDLELNTTDSQVFVKTKTGSIDHSILFGFDYSQSEAAIISGFALAPSIDVYNPVYGAAVPDLFTYEDFRQPVRQTGAYFQDHIKIAKRLVATVSGRQDWSKVTTDNRIMSSFEAQKASKFTGRVGLTYVAENGIAPYFSYSTSFLPQAGANADGEAFDPTDGKQFEGGVKFQPKNWNSFVTASLFQITQTNVLTPDPRANGSDPKYLNAQVATGEIRSRGFELEGVASVLQGLNLHLSYSKLAQEVTAANDISLGKRPTLAPDQLFGVTADYTFTRGKLSGLGAGFGVRYVGETAGNADNSLMVPSYGLMDLSVRYLWKNTEFLMSATNLADKTYVGVCTSVSYCNYGAKRNIIGSVRYRWNSWGKTR
ncbi:MAG TPA: TonB-dependent siderophore receptor [Candidatus Nanoarchaeia archaeon]|nr:TonB-dependent siderophore receptor [Candidatus Nanoarchaeia archaeon]